MSQQDLDRLEREMTRIIAVEWAKPRPEIREVVKQFLGVIREPTEQQLLAGNRASQSTSTLMDDTRFACERATFTAMLDKLLDETTPL